MEVSNPNLSLGFQTLQQAQKKAEVDYEAIEYWDFTLSKTEFANRYIKPYYKILTDYDNTNFPTDYITNCNNGGNCDGYGSFPTASKFILTDGTLFAVNPAYSAPGENQLFITIIVDINGLKKPNKYGRDIFMFSIQPKAGVIPYGIRYVSSFTGEQNFSRSYLLNGEYRSCQQKGIFCAAIIMLDNWDIAEDYPW